MSVSRREALLAGAGLSATALAWNTVTAQAPAAGAQPAAAGAKVPTGRDPLIGACMLVGGRRQIETCRFAMEKLQNEECKAFAKAEIEEHENNKAKLETMGLMYPNVPQEFQNVAPAGGAGAATGTDTATPPAGGAAQAGAVRPIPAVAVGKVVFPPPASDFVVVDHQIKEQCIANYKADMSKKQGLKFDKAFVGDQLHEHKALRDKVQVFQQHASAEMRPALDEGLRIIQQHIATCEQLMNKLDQMQDGQQRREGNTTDRDKDK